MHPIAGFLGRADAAAPELIDLIEVGQLDLELQRRAVAVAARQRHRQPRIQTLAVCGLDLSPARDGVHQTIDRQHVV
jgi:hypothetical protein